MKDLKDINVIVKIYELNLNNAFNKMNELIQIKYGQKYFLKITNVFNLQTLFSNFDRKDKEIILCLQLLKTFLDIYKYKEKNNILNFQTISHIINIKILKLLDWKI